MTQVLRRYTLYGVPEILPDGEKKREAIGEIRAALIHRSSEEVAEDDVERAHETAYALIPARYAPMGGFRRGMVLFSGEEGEYRMLTPLSYGRYWSVKCIRMHI